MGDRVETTTDAMAANADADADAGKVKPGGEELPLVTFALFAYNQEKYIREAVEGALAQDYSPLEIILSDDSSSDSTFQKMEEIVSAYGGARRIILNRNQDNLGIGAHINRIMAISTGELVVVAAGDDISSSDRTRHLVDAWLANHCADDLLCSEYEAMDEAGQSQSTSPGCIVANMRSEAMAKRGYGVLGATGAWTRRLWRAFGPLPQNVVHEDQVMPFRAAMLGGVLHVDKPLVRYRQGVSTWVARGATHSTTEMNRRTMLLKSGALTTCSAQLQDALSMNRYDLAGMILQRSAGIHEELEIISGRMSISNVLWRRISNLLIRPDLISMRIKILFPAVYEAVLRYRTRFNRHG